MGFEEKHTKQFLMQMSAVACLAVMMTLLMLRGWEAGARRMLFEHDAAVVSFLLDHGISRQTAAEAVLSDGTLAEGEELLHKIGISAETDIRFMPAIYEVCAAQRRMVSLGGVLLLLLLFTCIFRYLGKTDRIYRDAAVVVERYMDNDFSLRLPELDGGALYRLFSRVNFMAAMLKTKQEAENRAKEFLKTSVADISHQLKTPIAALSLYQEIIRNEPDQIRTVVDFTKKSEAALSRMEGLVKSLLRITRLDAGSVVFSPKVYDAEELVRQAVEELADRAKREEKEIILSGDNTAKVFCDMEWSREGLGNVVKNALDHTGRGDKIIITWEQTPLMTRFTVADTGEGIAPEDIHHIFKRFYRSRKEQSAGVGLGLSVAKAIMEGQGGTIGVQSGTERGTKFMLSFLTKS